MGTFVHRTRYFHAMTSSGTFELQYRPDSSGSHGVGLVRRSSVFSCTWCILLQRNQMQIGLTSYLKYRNLHHFCRLLCHRHCWSITRFQMEKICQYCTTAHTLPISQRSSDSFRLDADEPGQRLERRLERGGIYESRDRLFGA